VAEESALGLFNLKVIFGIAETGAEPVEGTTLCSLVPFLLVSALMVFFGGIGSVSSLLDTDPRTDGLERGEPRMGVGCSSSGDDRGPRRPRTSRAASMSSAVGYMCGVRNIHQGNV
jgi:hypothetical protein